MIIDFHCHLAPPEWRATRPLPPVLTDIDGFFAAKEAAGIDFSVIGNAMVNMPGAKFDNLSLDQIQAWNEFAHRLVASHSRQLAALVGIDPFGGAPMLKELEQAVQEGGFKGVTINSSVDGRYLDSPEAEDFWALVAALGVPIFVHPPSSPAGAERLHDVRVVEFAARSADVGLSMAAAVFAGVLERHPTLRIVCATGGGGLSMLTGRLDVAYHSSGSGPPGRPGGPPGDVSTTPRTAQPPSYYVQQLYVDTCSYSLPALLCNVQTFGAQHVVFGTDFPPVRIPPSMTIDLVRQLPFSDEDKERILWRNAAELLALDTVNA